ncbi:hypothetical protein BGZ97_001701 [Linnemannia gamsii]|uniref:Uncharacterized protein n=1 Tax=Linnemannia gamsii TaxID=64522 RepID=A0A9P6QY03_9FUNG|nr:hypothetical protein BGZ97_001701 [Linnemannia gamsii]
MQSRLQIRANNVPLFFGWDDLRILLREDYRLWKQDQRHQQQHSQSPTLTKDKEGKEEQPSLPPKSSSSSSMLSRYGVFIKKVSLGVGQLTKVAPTTILFHISQPRSLAEATRAHLHFPVFGTVAPLVQEETPSVPAPNASTDPDLPEPTPQELLLHLLRQCPNLCSLDLNGWSPEDEHAEFWKEIAENVMPRLQEFVIRIVYGYPATENLPNILAAVASCSSNMRKLILPQFEKSLQVMASSGAQGGVRRSNEEPADHAAWSKFMKGCVNLERLEIVLLDRGWTQVLNGSATHLRSLKVGLIYLSDWHLLVDSLRSGHLPCLDDINFCFDQYGDGPLVTDQNVADLISAGQVGWRSIRLSELGPLAVEALIEHGHCSTIESIVADETVHITSDQLRRVFSSSPNLHTFVTLDNEPRTIPSLVQFSVRDFINFDNDNNDDTGRHLMPWACESSLRVLAVKNTDVPRPDITVSYYNTPIPEGATIPEAYPGEGLELQRRVYERLSRFRSLEVLELGHDDRDFGVRDYIQNAEGEMIHNDTEDYQYSCVDMSLGSGLKALGELKRLRRLNVARMATSIGVEEVQWMTQSWPRLEELNGLNVEQEEQHAQHWLIENCPAIASRQFKFSFDWQ